MERFQIYKGNETILVVDDESIVRNLIKVFLKDLGYKVITAVNGEDAVNKFTQHIDTIKVVVMDVVMPIKDGITAYREIKEIKPDAYIFLLSGYQNSHPLLANKPPEIQIIPKPCRPVDIVKRIRTALEGTA